MNACRVPFRFLSWPLPSLAWVHARAITAYPLHVKRYSSKCKQQLHSSREQPPHHIQELLLDNAYEIPRSDILMCSTYIGSTGDAHLNSVVLLDVQT